MVEHLKERCSMLLRGQFDDSATDVLCRRGLRSMLVKITQVTCLDGRSQHVVADARADTSC